MSARNEYELWAGGNPDLYVWGKRKKEKRVGVN
jgi:hypothetical protein